MTSIAGIHGIAQQYGPAADALAPGDVSGQPHAVDHYPDARQTGSVLGDALS